MNTSRLSRLAADIREHAEPVLGPDDAGLCADCIDLTVALADGRHDDARRLIAGLSRRLALADAVAA